MAKTNPIGIILWKGKSLLDGERIAVVATGIFTKTDNRKTGDMIQLYILRADIPPILAKRLGEDKSICGDCKHRDSGTCYVNLCHGPVAIYNALVDGSYSLFKDSDIDLFKNRNIRLGSYGDPAAVPFEVWEKICSVASSFTGYSHQWNNKKIDQRLKKYCMASVDRPEEYLLAKKLGWRTFRIKLSETDKSQICNFDFIIKDGQRQEVSKKYRNFVQKYWDKYTHKLDNEIVCRASDEFESAYGYKLTCEKCKLCQGVNAITNKDIAINFHNHGVNSYKLRNLIDMWIKIEGKKAWRRDYKTERKMFKEICKS